MPRSSRHKSHKQSKHSLKEVKEYSDSEGEDVKMKESGSGSGRVLKDSSYLVSGEKRKLVLQFKEGKDLSGHGNGDAGEEYVSSKRRKEKADTSGGGGGGGDRWIGGGDGKGESGGESLKVDVEKSTKSREIKGESKSKGSKRHESDRKEENVSLVVDKDESRSVSRSESKRKSEKEKDSKDLKEVKDKDRVSEREKKLDGNVTKKQDPGEDKQSRRSRNDTEEELQNLEMEKESEKKTRKKREGSDERRVSSKSERTKRDEKHKEDSSYQDDIRHREKYREESDRDSRRRDEKYREHKHRENGSRRDRDEGEKDIKRRDEKYREDHEDDNNNNRHKEDKHRGDDYDRESREKRVRDAKYVSKDRSSDKNHTSRKCSSPVYDDRVTRYNKDDLDRRKIEKDDQSRRSASRNADVEHNRRRTSPSSSSQIPRDQYRGIKQEESKYREYGYEDRDRDRGRVGREFSNEKKNLRMNIRNSPMALTEKSPSSRRSLDVEESKEEESVSSPFNRKSILPPPLQYGGGFEDDNRGNKSNNNNNNRYNNNNRRMNDSSHLGRVQGGGNNNNNWRGGGVPNWTPPMGNGFMPPFQHGPPFHHVMHQQNFGPPIFNVNVRPSIDMNHGYSNHVRPMGWRNSVDDSLHNWDSNNNNNNNSNVFVDDSNLPYWDNNNGRNWENNRDIWKGQNSHESSLPPQQVTNEESQPYVHEDVNESKISEEKIVEAPKISHEETLMIEEKSIEKVEEENDDRVFVMYLKKLDISSDLIEPEVSDLLLDLDMEKGNDVICDVECKGFLEHEALEDRVGTIKAPLFSASDECVFQKAMNLYKKQKGELKVRNEENVLALSVVKNDGEKVGPNYSNEVEGSLLSNASMEVQVTSDVGVDNVEEEATVEDTMMIMMNGHDLPADNNKGKEEECEVVMNESIESEGVVNLSGIHSHSHSPESTR